ncbi:hypothetical protein SADUNF_Sadunf17G0003800 [Salix dunnii]|uniref:Protein kinase domain-containing protein n=1 Tax=Salix dunnii TaxID=1413687 RepID=A0A835J7C8_9ROSI|nr:hypothetical protein SADUNF_Sadunf17G0003800 [Salix dunnii]
MAFVGAKLALLLIHILGVAGDGYSSLQENYNGSDNHEHPKRFDSPFKSGLVIGYVFSSVSICTIFLSYCVPWARLNKRKRNKMTMKTPMMVSLMERHEKKRTEANEQICKLGNVVKRWSFVGISNATANFSQANKIGLGRMGTMYKATLPDGRFLAVKRIVDFHQFEEQIVSELKTLGTLRHKNLLPIYGFCVESNTRLLVYKYTSNGNLFDWIHSVKHRRRTLPLGLRLKIAVGVARGLARLHHGCRGQVVHLNISSKCILLDRDFEPKLSNFGKAMLMRMTSASGVLKEDVHGFGVVLLELITGMDCSRMDFSSNGTLNEWTGHLLSASYFYDAMDRFLIGQGFDDEIFQLLKVACNCLDGIPDRRPTMIQVYKDIKAITERCEVVDDSVIDPYGYLNSSWNFDNTTEGFICRFMGVECWNEATLTVSAATATDIYCLKSIKNSVIDPYGHLNSSWNFDNTTEGFICGFLGIECWHPNENRVLNIRLPDLGLEGQFPLGLENCTSLTGLNFSHNKLQGPIPSDISERLAYITDLDLSYNNFSGEIPSDIANCSFLNSLRLDHNQLTGNIPAQIGFLERLEIFSVADNLLSGPVPNFVKANVNYANNPGLCGGPLDPCKGHSDEFHSSFRTGFAAGCMFFSVSVIVGFLSHCAPWVDVRKRTAIQTMVMLIFRKNRIEADNLSGSPSAESIHGGGKEGLTIYDFVHVKKRIERQIMVMLISRKNRIEADNLSGSPSAESIHGGGKEVLTISDFVHDSMIDPHGDLNSSWNFDNTTEGFICRFTGVECWHLDANKMARLFLIYSFMSSLLATITVTTATATDIYCLKSIKDSVIDPYGHLNSSWIFDNKTEEGFICGFMGVDCWHDGENRVLNIRLSGKGLKGQFPLGLKNCTSLTGLDFSHNKLQGPIPSDISERLPYITSLDLSYNNFSGEIPSDIANCFFLNSLKLDHNQLTGNIPQQIGLLDRMKAFSVANNQLSGPLPNFGTVIPYDSFANNAGLCGKPLKNCSSHQRKFEHYFKASVAICFTSSCVPWVYAGERKKKITILGMLMRRRKHKITEDDQAGSSLLKEGTKEVSMLEQRVTRMSYADLNEATDNFSESNVIGQGKVGILYKASLPNGYVLAVKKLHDFQFLEEQFISELKILGSLRHINLLPLLGFCIEQNQRFLVYKYMPNGNLYDWLHPKEESQEKVMEWGVRVKIAIGLARGLAWIHHNCHTVRIIHLDISSKCILLDRNFQPKLSNFGEAMLMRSTCTSSINIELWEMAFVKEDVHGFGVVLLELITRVDPRNMTDSSNNILNEWTDLLSSSSSYGAIDKSLIGQGFDAEIFQLLKVACRCVDPNPDRRPIMLQVYEDIKAIRERCDLADDSENLMRPEICPTRSKST